MVERRRLLILSIGAIGYHLLGPGHDAQAQEPPSTPIASNLLSNEGLPPEQVVGFYYTHEQTWNEYDIPAKINIPKINFTSKIIKVDDTREGDDYAFNTPDHGIATPSVPIPKTVFIFGHSRDSKTKAMQKFSKIAKLQLDDKIFIQNEIGKTVGFYISEFRLVNRDKEDLVKKTDTTLVLQTSAANANQDWILDHNEVLSKVGDNLPEDISGNLVFVVFAKPILS